MSGLPFELDGCRVVRATEKALLVWVDDLGEEVWIPRSVVHDDSEVWDDGDNSEGILVIQMRFAEDRGWV